MAGDSFKRSWGQILAKRFTLRPRISRAQADCILADVLKRAEEINEREELTDRVTKIYVFGSYLTAKADLGDIDLAVELDWRWPDFERYDTANRARVEVSGRYLGYWTKLHFGAREVLQILKARNRYISFHEFYEVKRFGAPHRQIFPAKGRKQWEDTFLVTASPTAALDTSSQVASAIVRCCRSGDGSTGSL